MVIADLNMLCVGQQYVSNLDISKANILVYNRNTCKECIYSDKYSYLQGINGIWYQIEPQDRDYTNEFFDLICDNKENRVILIDDSYEKYFISFIETMLNDSPENTVFFLINFQGFEDGYEEICFSKFKSMFKSNMLKFNVVYKIVKNKN